jgi:hypothetical protein
VRWRASERATAADPRSGNSGVGLEVTDQAAASAFTSCGHAAGLALGRDGAQPAANHSSGNTGYRCSFS